MRLGEYALLAASAIVSVATNLVGAIGRRAPRRILVVKLDHLGDVVAATPALRALRGAHPDAAIDLLVASPVAPLFEGKGRVVGDSASEATAGAPPLATRVLSYDSPRYHRGRSARDETGLRAVLGQRYDTIVELRGDWRTLLLPIPVGARRRVDRGSVRLRDWVARRFGSRRPPLHEVETNIAVVRPLLPRHPAASIGGTEVAVTAEARAAMERRLAASGLDPERDIVCLHPGAAWRPRAWRPERFAAIADWIASHYDAQIVFIGSVDERDLESALRARVRAPRAAFLFGALALPEVAALLQRARLLVGNDSGIAHLAAACGTPTVALFGAQDPRRFRPWSERSITLHHPVPCFPCAQVRCVCPELPCVNRIEVAEVEAAVRSLLR